MGRVLTLRNCSPARTTLDQGWTYQKSARPDQYLNTRPQPPPADRPNDTSFSSTPDQATKFRTNGLRH
ncbi:uncharacterized protein LAJ45_04021 [Morchella importuna]|uniref:uncharacterized protein n=1 Tax=Morchella importuna TaxID=1174673 RepID=UPI001E8DF30A|nr:uncharacterized protein LAJ45_04021 [Morchella importuna]KAH8152028.1 hypothetical protein LAJ45_04021 [Morchella importuna]